MEVQMGLQGVRRMQMGKRSRYCAGRGTMRALIHLHRGDIVNPGRVGGGSAERGELYSRSCHVEVQVLKMLSFHAFIRLSQCSSGSRSKAISQEKRGKVVIDTVFMHFVISYMYTINAVHLLLLLPSPPIHPLPSHPTPSAFRRRDLDTLR
jgi:hypothetical protein